MGWASLLPRRRLASPKARAAFYGALVVGALLLMATGLIISTSGRHWRTAGSLLIRTFAGVALAGVLGLLLDCRDGPVRTVQLFVYLVLVLGIGCGAVTGGVEAVAGRRGDDAGEYGSCGQPASDVLTSSRRGLASGHRRRSL